MRVAAATLIAGILALVLYILTVALTPAQWEFGLEIETEVAEVEFQPNTETRWLIDGAVICARNALTLPAAFRLPDETTSCGSRAWRGWQIQVPEQVIVLRGGTSAMLEASRGGLAVSLRGEENQSVGMLFVTGTVDGIDLGPSLNLIWGPGTGSRKTFPFSGTTTLGRAVSWSDPRMLRAGRVAVYTSDESADQRTLVDEADLMLGDQVRLGADSAMVWPKGFIRLGSQTDGDEPLQVVAFGRADSLSIERYGDSGYDFKPSYLSKLASDPGITFWSSLLIAYMTVVLGLAPFADGETVPAELVPARYRYLRWLFKVRKP